jgi:general stress protein 26
MKMSDIPDRVREVMQAVGNVHVLATVDAEGKPQMRWMGALVEDPDTPWTFYLACMAGSRKMQQLAANAQAQLLFTKQDDWQVATVSGTAEAVDCPEIRKLLWDTIPAMHTYYSAADDPKMAILKFTTKCMELLAMSEDHKVHCFEL